MEISTSDVFSFNDLPKECQLQIIDKVGPTCARICKKWNDLLNNNRLWEDRCVSLQTPTTEQIPPGYRRREVQSLACKILNFSKSALGMQLPYGGSLDEVYSKNESQILNRLSADQTTFEIAARSEDFELIKWFLNQEGLVTSAKNALIEASKEGRLGVFNLLLEHPTITIADVKEALFSASQYGWDKIVKTLLDREEIVMNDVVTALEHASQNGHSAVVHLLLNKNPSKDAVFRVHVGMLSGKNPDISQTLLRYYLPPLKVDIALPSIEYTISSLQKDP